MNEIKARRALASQKIREQPRLATGKRVNWRGERCAIQVVLEECIGLSRNEIKNACRHLPNALDLYALSAEYLGMPNHLGTSLWWANDMYGGDPEKVAAWLDNQP